MCCFYWTRIDRLPNHHSCWITFHIITLWMNSLEMTVTTKTIVRTTWQKLEHLFLNPIIRGICYINTTAVPVFELSLQSIPLLEQSTKISRVLSIYNHVPQYFKTYLIIICNKCNPIFIRKTYFDGYFIVDFQWKLTPHEQLQHFRTEMKNDNRSARGRYP